MLQVGAQSITYNSRSCDGIALLAWTKLADNVASAVSLGRQGGGLQQPGSGGLIIVWEILVGRVGQAWVGLAWVGQAANNAACVGQAANNAWRGTALPLSFTWEKPAEVGAGAAVWGRWSAMTTFTRFDPNFGNDSEIA